MRLTLTRPDDWHLHLRDGDIMAAVLPDTARRFARAIVMSNLKPPVTTVGHAHAYRERLLAALPASMSFEPLMTLHLTEDTAPSEIAKARASGFVHAVKYYPADATINVLFQFFNVFNARAEHGSAFNRHFFRNRWLWLSLVSVLALQALVVHWAPAQAIFHTTDLALADWGLAALVAASVLVLDEAHKLAAGLWRWRSNPPASSGAVDHEHRP